MTNGKNGMSLLVTLPEPRQTSTHVESDKLAPKISAPESSMIRVIGAQGGSVEALLYHDTIPKESKFAELFTAKKEVRLVQCLSTEIMVECGSQNRILVFPVPVNGAMAKTRIARKSQWIEVTVPLVKLGALSNLVNRLSPKLSLRAGLENVALGPRVCIDQQASVSLHGNGNWLRDNFGYTFSAADINAIVKGPRERRGKLGKQIVDFKQTQTMIFTLFPGWNLQAPGLKYQGCSLYTSGLKSCAAVFYFDCLRHDGGTGSIFLDGWSIRLDMSPYETNKRGFHIIELSDHELPLWQAMIPVYAERCRVGWTHRQSCAYDKCQTKESSVAGAVCACGDGKAT